MLYSLLLTDADSYWIARHGVVLLYALAATPFLKYKIPKVQLAYVYIALICALFFSYVGWLIPGHANFVVFQVCIVLLCILYERVQALLLSDIRPCSVRFAFDERANIINLGDIYATCNYTVCENEFRIPSIIGLSIYSVIKHCYCVRWWRWRLQCHMALPILV